MELLEVSDLAQDKCHSSQCLNTANKLLGSTPRLGQISVSTWMVCTLSDQFLQQRRVPWCPLQSRTALLPSVIWSHFCHETRADTSTHSRKICEM